MSLNVHRMLTKCKKHLGVVPSLMYLLLKQQKLHCWTRIGSVVYMQDIKNIQRNTKLLKMKQTWNNKRPKKCQHFGVFLSASRFKASTHSNLRPTSSEQQQKMGCRKRATLQGNLCTLPKRVAVKSTMCLLNLSYLAREVLCDLVLGTQWQLYSASVIPSSCANRSKSSFHDFPFSLFLLVWGSFVWLGVFGLVFPMFIETQYLEKQCPPQKSYDRQVHKRHVGVCLSLKGKSNI